MNRFILVCKTSTFSIIGVFVIPQYSMTAGKQDTFFSESNTFFQRFNMFHLKVFDNKQAATIGIMIFICKE